MSIWLLIAAGLLAWTLVSAALALWIGRVLRARRRGGTIDFVPFAGIEISGVTVDLDKGSGIRVPPYDHEESSAA